jgi:cytochrome c oxidase cbb3-type subunit 4
MDINIFRTAMTVIMFAVFLGICAWAWSGKQRARFDHAAHSVLDDDDEKGVPAADRPGTRRA